MLHRFFPLTLLPWPVIMLTPTAVFLFFQLFFTVNAILFLLLLLTFFITFSRCRAPLSAATSRLPLNRLAEIVSDDFDRSLAGYQHEHDIIKKMAMTTDLKTPDDQPLTIVVVSEDFLKKDFDLI